MPRINVVLLNWNDREQTELCLDRVLRSEGVDLDVVVVDNGSAGDDMARLVARLGPERVLGLPENRGYAGGMNEGLDFWRRSGGGAPVLILTPDAAVRPDTLRLLLAELEASPEAGVVGPLVFYSRGPRLRIGAGGVVEPHRTRTRLLDGLREPVPHDVDWIDGCCMLVRAAVLAEVAGFDERYFIYFEETDFCGRVRLAGWRVRLVPSAEIDHPKSAGTLPPYYFYYMVRNRFLFWRDNYDVGFARVAAQTAVATARAWASVPKSLLMSSRRREWRGRLREARLQLRAVVTGTADHLRGRYGPMGADRMPRS